MAVATRKPRYRLGGDLTLPHPKGGVRRFVAGDELPADFQAQLSTGEINAHLAIGLLLELGKPSAPRQAEAPPTPPTPQEILTNFGLPTSGPRVTVPESARCPIRLAYPELVAALLRLRRYARVRRSPIASTWRMCSCKLAGYRLSSARFSYSPRSRNCVTNKSLERSRFHLGP